MSRRIRLRHCHLDFAARPQLVYALYHHLFASRQAGVDHNMAAGRRAERDRTHLDGLVGLDQIDEGALRTALNRCQRRDDWLRREIVHALTHGKNVIPLLADGFQFPSAETIQVDLIGLQRLNGIVYSHEYFNAAFDKLEGFLKGK